MNILFVNNSEINPLNSGIQRITYVLARAFTSRGHRCYGANFEKDTPSSNELFIDTLKLDYSEDSSLRLAAFIRRHNIIRIIVQECMPLIKLKVVSQAISDIDTCKLYYCNHSAPGKEFVRPSLNVEFYRLLHQSGKKNSLFKTAVALLPPSLYSAFIRSRVQKDYSYIYRHADRVVLLSRRYIPIFQKLSGLTDCETSHFIGIGNSLSFPQNLPSEKIAEKQKEILLIGRLSDRAKRFSTALRIWQQIEHSRQFPDWRLKIIGSGPDEKYYRHLAQKLRLKQIDFEGKQNPQPYYQRAAICMLTSAYEGFGMVLTEAQQMGVVPIAFDTYTALHDIIENKRNGIIVPANDNKTFTEQLSTLMKNTELRNEMAQNALIDCQKFSEENIIRQWLSCLLQSRLTTLRINPLTLSDVHRK